jgi:hypothetical protein
VFGTSLAFSFEDLARRKHAHRAAVTVDDRQCRHFRLDQLDYCVSHRGIGADRLETRLHQLGDFHTSSS